MTFEEAKKIFLNRGYIEVPGGTYYDADKWRESVAVISEWLEKEPCEDCISRQAVLEKAIDYGSNTYLIPVNSVKALPPVTPKEKTGRWITQWDVAYQKEYYYCSECREEFSYDCETGVGMNDYDFCPNCGAKMEVENEKEC